MYTFAFTVERSRRPTPLALMPARSPALGVFFTSWTHAANGPVHARQIAAVDTSEVFASLTPRTKPPPR
jgi:hypothetical protein